MCIFLCSQSAADDEATGSKVPLPNLSQTLRAIANIFGSQAASSEDTIALELKPASSSAHLNEDADSQDTRVPLDQFDQNITVLFRQVHKSHAHGHVAHVTTHGHVVRAFSHDTCQFAGFRVTEAMGDPHHQVGVRVLCPFPCSRHPSANFNARMTRALAATGCDQPGNST